MKASSSLPPLPVRHGLLGQGSLALQHSQPPTGLSFAGVLLRRVEAGALTSRGDEERWRDARDDRCEAADEPRSPQTERQAAPARDSAPPQEAPVPVHELCRSRAGDRVGPSVAQPVTTSALVSPLAVQDLARQMLRSVSIHQLGSQIDLRLRVATAKLPELGISLRLEAGRLRATLEVQDRAGQDLLRSVTHELEAALEARGLPVQGGVQVELDPAARAGAEAGRGGGGQDRPGREQAGGTPGPARRPRRTPAPQRSARPRRSTDYIT